jgi:ribosome-binding protein aMBF1 (putative translation factor)
MNDFEIKTFKDKTDLYEKYFSFGYTLNEDLSDKLKLIHLICLVTFKMRNSEPNITCREVLERILKINLDDNLKIQNNQLILNFLKDRTTLFKIIKNKIKKGFGV